MTTKPYIKIIDASRLVGVAGAVFGVEITHSNLQVILYYMQAWHLAHFDHPLYSDDVLPEAWVRGPVYRKIYQKYKIYNSEDLSKSWYGSIDDAHELLEQLAIESKLDIEQLELIKNVFESYLPMGSLKLMWLTHSEDPWQEVRKKYEPFGNCTEKISAKSMKDYYKKRLKPW